MRAVAHEHQRSVRRARVFALGQQRLHHRFIILVGGQKRRAQRERVKLVFIRAYFLYHIVVLIAVHDVRGLHDDFLHAVGHQPVHGFGHVVDLEAVALGQDVNDGLRREGAAHFVVGIRGGDVGLNSADGGLAAVVVAGAEADHQNHGLRIRGLRAGKPRAGAQQRQRKQDRNQLLHLLHSFRLGQFCALSMKRRPVARPARRVTAP